MPGGNPLLTQLWFSLMKVTLRTCVALESRKPTAERSAALCGGFLADTPSDVLTTAVRMDLSMKTNKSNGGRTGMARVYCLICRRRKTIPESPRALPRTLRTGCSRCGRITRFKLVGVP